jgi:hypothetical protein
MRANSESFRRSRVDHFLFGCTANSPVFTFMLHVCGYGKPIKPLSISSGIQK